MGGVTTPSAAVQPTRDDPVVADAAEVIGGPIGRRFHATAASWWTPLRVVFVLCFVMFTLGVVMRAPCAAVGFDGPQSYVKQCYTDVGVLFPERGLDRDTFPYSSRSDGTEVVEYPVLQGAVMWVVALLVPNDLDATAAVQRYYGITAVAMFALALIAVWATMRTARARPWDAAIVAAVPSIALVGTLNWDLLPVALTALFLLAWSRSEPWIAGILLGLAVAAKFYPVVLLGPLLLVCWRAARMSAFLRVTIAALAVWAAVNLPIAVGFSEGWGRFFELSTTRGADFGSIWLALDLSGITVSDRAASTLSGALFVLLCIGIAALAWCAPRRPRFASLALLTIAAFVLSAKVYSPQYALWLLPFVALARPRWRDVLIWQGGQAIYYVGVWLWLQGFVEADRALSDPAYAVLILVQVASTLWICGVVVRDVLRPECDPVRADGVDDPTGGPCEGRADRPGMPWLTRGARPAPMIDRDDAPTTAPDPEPKDSALKERAL
jgi:uncharacterized membrane protein